MPDHRQVSYKHCYLILIVRLDNKNNNCQYLWSSNYKQCFTPVSHLNFTQQEGVTLIILASHMKQLRCRVVPRLRTSSLTAGHQLCITILVPMASWLVRGKEQIQDFTPNSCALYPSSQRLIPWSPRGPGTYSQCHFSPSFRPLPPNLPNFSPWFYIHLFSS